MTLNGNITKGMGVAKKWVKMVEKPFQKNFGIKLFSGTLNIKLLTNYIVKPDLIIKPEEYGGTQNVLVQKCNISKNGEKIKEAFIVRAAKNETEKGDHFTNIIEIVSDVNLRETYHLKDNDLISIEVFTRE